MNLQVHQNEKGQWISSPTDRKLGRSRVLFEDQEDRLQGLNAGKGQAIRLAVDYCLEHCPEIFEAKS